MACQLVSPSIERRAIAHHSRIESVKGISRIEDTAARSTARSARAKKKREGCSLGTHAQDGGAPHPSQINFRPTPTILAPTCATERDKSLYCAGRDRFYLFDAVARKVGVTLRIVFGGLF